jgi:RecB family exonuclease
MSEQTVAGWTIAHSFFTDVKKDGSLPDDDAYRNERYWWRNPAVPPNLFPAALFPLQKNGFRAWTARARTDGAFNLFATPFPLGERAFATFLAKPVLSVSATGDLDVFFECSVKWLFKRLFKLDAEDLDAKLLDDEGRGLLYHRILRVFFQRVRDEEPGGVFFSGHIERYRAWLSDAARDECAHYHAFRGALAAPLLGAMARAITGKLRRLLRVEVENFDNWKPAFLEEKLDLKRGALRINGVIDRVSIAPDSDCAIIDYKSGEPPAIKSCWNGENNEPLSRFQLALYIMLYESRGQKTAGASFISINKCKTVNVVCEDGKTNKRSRENYEATLQTVSEKIDEFARAVRALDFAADVGRYAVCAGCDYCAVCRRTYALGETDAAL